MSAGELLIDPLLNVRGAEPPKLSNVNRLDLAGTSHLLQRFRVNPNDGSGHLAVDQWFGETSDARWGPTKTNLLFLWEIHYSSSPDVVTAEEQTFGTGFPRCPQPYEAKDALDPLSPSNNKSYSHYSVKEYEVVADVISKARERTRAERNSQTYS